MQTVKMIKLDHCPAKQLTRGSEYAAGFDLKSAVNIRILPGQRVKIPTGVKIEMPDGMEAQCRPRSGMAFNQGLTLINTPGTIDSDFRGELCVLAFNANPVISAELWVNLMQAINMCRDEGNDIELAKQFEEWVHANTIEIFPGDRIAQLVFASHEVPLIVDAPELSVSLRGEGGFGSTGSI
jgi:dUTP pyrophosphatase